MTTRFLTPGRTFPAFALATLSKRRVSKMSRSPSQAPQPIKHLVVTRVGTKTRRIASAVAFVAGVALTTVGTMAQAPGIQRIDLLKSDLSVPGREVVQVLVNIAPGVVAPSHSHPGEEIAYVVEGTLEYALEGRPPVTLKAGEALFIPVGVPHAVTNVGDREASELATYIVQKGKPLIVLAK